ncbi:MAG: porin [Sulfuritalea sp.]|nr:porin [Sulfuritalea sp.]
MQKKLIAAAVAGLIAVPALAQSNVTISGQMRVGIQNISAGGATAAGASLESRSMLVDNNSNIRFAGTEALGGGLTAWWQVESAIGTTDNIGTTGAQNAVGNVTSIGTRNTAVGIRGAWGNVYMGKWDMHYSNHAGVDSAGLAGGLAVGANTLNILHTQNGANSAGGRYNNAVMYDSPNWNGFDVRLGYSFTAGSAATAQANNESTAVNSRKESNWMINPRYTNGPIHVFYSHLARNNIGNVVSPAASPDARFDRLGGAYTFGMGLKVGLIWDRNRLSPGAGAASTKRSAWALPVTYVMGPHTFNGTYARANDVSNTNNTGANMWMLGYTYSLSKRTHLGFNWTKIRNESAARYDLWHPSSSAAGASGAALPLGSDPRQLSFNIHHSF